MRKVIYADSKGNWVSLVQMWRLFRRTIPLAITGITCLTYFISVMQSMDMIPFEWHSWFSDVQASLGRKDPTAAAFERVSLPVLDKFDEMTNGTYRSEIQGWMDAHDKEIGQAVSTFVGSTISTLGIGAIKGAVGVMTFLGSAIAGWARMRG